MLLSLQKEQNKKKQKKTTNKQTNNQKNQQIQNTQKTATTYSSPCLHHRWRCYQAIALNDQQVGPTCLGAYSQSNLLDRMLRLHSYQPCPQDYCTNV